MPNDAPAAAPTAPDLRYLRLLSRQFPTLRETYTEVIRLEAQLDLPKSAEHFMSDVHGEYEAFKHILNNCSGVIREHVEDVFGSSMDEDAKDDLCTLIYYPNEMLALQQRRRRNEPNWYTKTLMELVRIARQVSSLYTSNHVREALPDDFESIIEELLRSTGPGETSRHEYHHRIIDSIVENGVSDDFIIALCVLIKRLSVEHLHLVGDIYDRGPHGDRIMDRLMAHHNLDIQWGNHDIAWMGAACGSEACIASVVRTQIRYHTLDVVESAYGISLRELALFAERTYRGDESMSPMEKAISVILFKVEAQFIMRHPNWGMEDRLLLDDLDLEHGTVRIEGVDYELATCDFPTVDPEHPFQLTAEERTVMDGLVAAFRESTRLRAHTSFLYEKGSVYLVHNGNLLFHGCLPLEDDGSFTAVVAEGVPRAGRAYLDWCDRIARRAWHTGDQCSLDWMWYLWCGRRSPLSGRVMKTFERTFVLDKSTWVEAEDPYFRLTDDASVCERVLAEFGLTGKHSHIINGHKPVKQSSGESPIKGDARRLVVDGGFCEAYHKTTGIAGYTLTSTANGMTIKAHRPFVSVKAALAANADILSNTTAIEQPTYELTVADTDRGKELADQIRDLKALLAAYRAGELPEGAA